MSTTAVLATILVVQGLILGSAKLLGAAGMPDRATHVGFTADAYRKIGGLEVMAAIGIAVGVAVPILGVLAAGGLLLLLAGAVVAHVRAGDSPKELAPAVIVAALTAAYLLTLLVNH